MLARCGESSQGTSVIRLTPKSTFKTTKLKSITHAYVCVWCEGAYTHNVTTCCRAVMTASGANQALRGIEFRVDGSWYFQALLLRPTGVSFLGTFGLRAFQARKLGFRAWGFGGFRAHLASCLSQMCMATLIFTTSSSEQYSATPDPEASMSMLCFLGPLRARFL